MALDLFWDCYKVLQTVTGWIKTIHAIRFTGSNYTRRHLRNLIFLSGFLDKSEKLV